MNIADLELGQKAVIKSIDESHPSAFRLLEHGFTPGQEIEVISKPIFKDPIEVTLRGTIIAIRKKDALCINVSKVADEKE
ncbi:MAG: FeoA family protein [Ignavibacteria bacterium]